MKASERQAVLATIDPDAYTAAAYSSDYVDMKKVTRIQAIVMAGTMGTSGTINFKLQEATSATGAGAADLTGKAITAFSGTGDNDKQAIINLQETELSAGFRYVKAVMTVAVATCDAGAIILGETGYGPASDHDLSSVDEIV